jgi:hypothetical protein
MFQTAQGGYGLDDQVMTGSSVLISNKPNATGIPLFYQPSLTGIARVTDGS